MNLLALDINIRVEIYLYSILFYFFQDRDYVGIDRGTSTYVYYNKIIVLFVTLVPEKLC